MPAAEESLIVPRAAPLDVGLVVGGAEETRRVKRLAALYRMLCALLLLVVIAFLDLRALGVKNPYAFVVTSLLFFVYGVASWQWLIRQTRQLALKLTALIAVDTLFVGLLMEFGGASGSGLAVLLIPQLAANAWLLRTRLALFQAAMASLALVTVETMRVLEGGVSAAQLFQTGLTGLGLFAASALGVVLGRYYGVSEKLAAQRGVDLANLEQVNRLIIQDMQDGVLVVDERGIVRRHNAPLERMLGGQTRLRDGMPLAELSPTLEQWWHQWQHEEMDATTTITPESSTRTFQLRFVPVGTDRAAGAIVYVEDLARTQQLAQQLKLAALGRLTGSIAHEIRNPLSAVSQAAQLLHEEELVPPDGKRLLGIIRNNSDRIERIVTEVLQINHRDKRNQQTIHLLPFAKALVEEIAQAGKLPADRIEIAIPEVLTGVFDRGHLEQILWNLVRNAWHFGKKNAGSVRISAHQGYRGDAVILEVTDDGPGVPPQSRSRLFEPFFTTRPGGTGLGLYVARELADANGATLELTDERPGAHFRLVLKRGVDRLLDAQ
jgi:two-component system sensor histidine kinase PilS (NtrC family)